MITSKAKKVEKGSNSSSESSSVDRHASGSSSTSTTCSGESSSESSSTSETESRSSEAQKNRTSQIRSKTSKHENYAGKSDKKNSQGSPAASGIQAAQVATAAGAGAIAGHHYSNKQSTDSQGHYTPNRSGEHFQGQHSANEHQYSDIPPPPPLPPPKSSHQTKSSDIPPPPPLDNAPASGNKPQKAQQPVQKSSSRTGSKSRRWNPFAKKEVPPEEVDDRIREYQLKAETELQKSQLAANQKDQEKATFHDSNASFGNRFTSVFRRIGQWSAERNHKNAHENYLDKISHLQARQPKQGQHN